MNLKEWQSLSREEQQRRLEEKPMTLPMGILGDCKCMRQAPKQAIEWALDYHLGTLRRDYRDLQRLIVEARTEYKEITGKDPGEYRAEAKLQAMQKEIDSYLAVRKEIIELPRCDEPAFETRNPGRTVAEILSGRTDYHAKRQAEMLAKDKLSMDNFDVAYEQLPDIRKSLVDLAYLRDEKAVAETDNPGRSR